ncbi:class I SAM-dependent methyltransferase [Bacillus sp. FJAT-42315]|uniref:class I SAM-dependent methyltransferase n=1 Tax=Bacillus sp. FJAT-42315 TaxID=2014077 RepID=UPI000C24C3A8|nr:class I SAM-dependent methyltransferase [Bacillus sp. FJAT-42315]
MANHYYSSTPESESNPTYWEYTLKNKMFRFKTDAGVFSKKEVDFGSRLLIEHFELPQIEGPLLDVGCGYGPIGLSIATQSSERLVHMIDVNQRALALAKDNAELNRISNVTVYESDRLEAVVEDQFAAILTNPPIRAGKQVVMDIFRQSFRKLAVGGHLWVVIQKKQGAPSAIKELESLFGEVETVERSKGYYILKAEKH